VRRQGPGISSEIEICRESVSRARASGVARGLASRLRLKSAKAESSCGTASRRQGPGISSEIEIPCSPVARGGRFSRQGPGISSEIEIIQAIRQMVEDYGSPGAWLLV